MVLDQIRDFLLNGDNFLITTHVNADGDAIASVLAFGNLLKKKNKKYKIVVHDAILSDRYQFLAGFDEIVSLRDFNSNGKGFSYAIILDAPGYKRIGDILYIMPPKENVLKIDHHPSEDDFAINYVDETRSSAAEMIIDVAECLDVEMDSEFATAVYTGISFDTGNFRFSNTTHRTLNAAAKLVEKKAEPSLISNNLYYARPFIEIKTLGKVLSNIEKYENDKIVLLYVPKGLVDELNKMGGDTDGFVDYTVSIKDVQVGALIKQISDDGFKISLRSHSSVDVNKIARKFRGGGHPKAAGCRMSGTYEEVKKRLLKEITKYA